MSECVLREFVVASPEADVHGPGKALKHGERYRQISVGLWRNVGVWAAGPLTIPEESIQTNIAQGNLVMCPVRKLVCISDTVTGYPRIYSGQLITQCGPRGHGWRDGVENLGDLGIPPERIAHEMEAGRLRVFSEEAAQPPAVFPPEERKTWDSVPEAYKKLVAKHPQDEVTVTFMTQLFKVLPEPAPTTTEGWVEWINQQKALAAQVALSVRPRAPREATRTIEYTVEYNVEVSRSYCRTDTATCTLEVPESVIAEAVENDDTGIISDWVSEHRHEEDRGDTEEGEEMDTESFQNSEEETESDWTLLARDVRAMMNQWAEENPPADEE